MPICSNPECGAPLPCPRHPVVVDNRTITGPGGVPLSQMDADDQAAFKASAIIAAGGKPVIRVYLGAGGSFSNVTVDEGPRWAVYHYVQRWLVDVAPRPYGHRYEHRFSADVTKAAMFDHPEKASEQMRTCDLYGPDEDHTRRGYYILQVR